MAESARLTKILLDILDRVKHRGSSTKVNWMNFSNGQSMSRAKFEDIILNFGLPLHDGDLDIIWANIECSGSSMSYSDFVRFITLENVDITKGGRAGGRAPSKTSPQPTYANEPPGDSYGRPPSNPSSRQMQSGGRAQPPPASAGRGQQQSSGSSLSRILIDHKVQIGNSLLNTDPSFTGFVSVREFEDIIQRIALVNSSEVQRLVAIYDQTNSGFFNYFMLLGDICNQTNEAPSASRGSSSTGGSYAQEPINDDYSRGGGYDSYQKPPSKGGYDDYSAPPQRSGYDDYPPAAAGPSGASRLKADDIIQQIADKMDHVYDSSQSCFQKWRGYASVLGPQEFTTGAQRDFKIDMTVDDAVECISRYSNKGHLSLGEFMKLVGAGTDGITEQRKQAQSIELTEDEKILMHIARQAKNKDWRSVFEQSDGAERVVQALRSQNIYVMLNDLRPCYNKFGKDGVISKIQGYIESL